jgi:hypothetical protein
MIRPSLRHLYDIAKRPAAAGSKPGRPRRYGYSDVKGWRLLLRALQVGTGSHLRVVFQFEIDGRCYSGHNPPQSLCDWE